MKPITWIHLADLHIDVSSSWDSNFVLKSLLKDIERLRSEYKLEPDFVFISGDLASSGKKEEYNAVKSFLEELHTSSGVPFERFFFVPGNHDIDRSAIGLVSRSIKATILGQKEEELLSGILSDEAARKEVFRPLSNYAEFAYEQAKISADQPFYTKKVSLPDVPVEIAILGLNSAWLTLDDNVSMLDRRQVLLALEKVNEKDYIIALIHHPISDLPEWNQISVGQIIEYHCDVLLRGHFHRTHLAVSQDAHTRCSVIAAGATYIGSKEYNGYNIVAVDFEKGYATAYLRHYRPEAGNWFEDNIYREPEPGQFRWKLSERFACPPIVKPSSITNQGIKILHLSDLHLENKSQARIYQTQLETDLIRGLAVNKLEYLLISGDIAYHASEEEYEAAFIMLDGICKRFNLDWSHVIVVPGNHDISWDDSESAYVYIPRRKLPLSTPPENIIPAGDAGALLCDEILYMKRFDNFSNFFFNPILGNKFPAEYAQQYVLKEYPEDRILFLGLNSSWQIDHYFKKRASVNIDALSNALDHLQDGVHDGWLKIAVGHHPVTGREMMNNDFIQLLVAHGFQIYMCGHIHESIEYHHVYDETRGINVIGAGTFGAPAKEVTGVPLQYNLLALNPNTGEITVNTRRKEKPNGAWAADARWHAKDSPMSYYKIQVKDYQR